MVIKEYSTLADDPVFARRTDYHFKEDGRLISKFEYKNGIEDEQTAYKEDSTEYMNNEIFSSAEVHYFNASGNLLYSILNERATYKDRKVKHYLDEKGNDTLSESFDMKGNKINDFKRSFDEKGRMISWTEFDFKNNHVSSTGTITYKEKDGKLVEMLLDSADHKKAVPKINIVVDAKGREIERFHYTKEKTKIPHYKKVYVGDHLKEYTIYKDGVVSVRYTHNEKGQMVKMEKLDITGKMVFNREAKYNAQGDMIYQSMTQSAGGIKVEWTYDYEYDQKGNWIKREEKENGRPYLQTRREFTYFE